MIPHIVTARQYAIANFYWGYPVILTAEMVNEALAWYYGEDE